jgi:hypothetical protein
LGLDQVQIVGDPLTHGGQVAEHIQMVLYAKTANLGHPTPPLERCVRHCCRPDTPAPVDRVNLDHPQVGSSCGGTNPKDPFPELVDAGLAGVVAGGAAPRRRASRLSEEADGG